MIPHIENNPGYVLHAVQCSFDTQFGFHAFIRVKIQMDFYSSAAPGLTLLVEVHV